MSHATTVTIEQKFLFDLQGFIILRGALDKQLCADLLAAVERLEKQEFADAWRAKLPPEQQRHRSKDTDIPNQIRLNGLPRLDPIFDKLVAHPAILPFLQEFQHDPQLVNTWAISKTKGCNAGCWHAGMPPEEYAVRNGRIFTPMLNVVFMLSDNPPESGCLLVQPGSHKKNFNLPYDKYGNCGLEMPGSIEVTGKAGDVVLFSESLFHNGGIKTTDAKRTNLYFNHMHSQRSVVVYDRANAHHYWMPPEVRARFSPEAKQMTRWMEMVLPIE